MECLRVAWETKTQTPLQKLVLARLADRANEQLNSCWPGIASLAKDCCLSESSVHRAIKGLIGIGVITVKLGGGRKPNTYFLTAVPGTPVSNGHPCPTDTGGVSNGYRRGVPQTPKPKENPKLTQRGGPQPISKDYEILISRAEDERDALKNRHAPDWCDKDALLLFRELGRKIKIWKTKMWNLNLE